MRWNRRRLRSFPRIAGILLLGLLAAWRMWDFSKAPPAAPSESGEQVVVRRAVDGDTLLLEDGRRVRLLGVDTPESKREGAPVEPWALDAHAFTRQMVEGRRVRLEFDKERHDRYERVLAYVYVEDKLLNEELLRAGLGKALLNHPYSGEMKRRFRRAETLAKEERLGIWNRKSSRRS
ncbi:MAG: thermonuclease family protein [Planctomycetales bacterium]